MLLPLPIRLKNSLAKALTHKDADVGRVALSSCTPADMAIRLLDSLIMGEQVRQAL